MEFRNINTFLKVAGTQNFSRAAQQLGYSQSAVTIQIRQLEEELQVQLFERIGKRVYLTEKGQEFVAYANEIMRAIRRRRRRYGTGFRSTGRRASGRIRRFTLTTCASW